MPGFSITPPSQDVSRQDDVMLQPPRKRRGLFTGETDPEDAPGPLSQSVRDARERLQSLKVDTIQSNRFVQNSQKDLLRQKRFESRLPEALAPQQDANSELILSARGTVYLTKLASHYGPGLYAVDDLTREVIAPDSASDSRIRDRVRASDIGNLINSQSPILITGIEFNQSDIVSQVPCLNNFKVFYSFGQNFGQAVVTGEVLLGPLGDVNADGVNRVVDFFWKYRVSERHLPIAVSVAFNAYYFYLTGMRIGKIDPQFHIMPFVLVGTLLDLKRETAASINLPGRVINGGSLNDPTLFKALISPSRELKNLMSRLGQFGKELKEEGLALLSSMFGKPGDTPAGAQGNATAIKIRDLNTKNAVTPAEKEYVILKNEQKKRKVARQIVGTDFPNIPPVPNEDDEKLDNAVRYAGGKIAQERNLSKKMNVRIDDFDGSDHKNYEEQLKLYAPTTPYGQETMPEIFKEKSLKDTEAEAEIARRRAATAGRGS